MTEYNFISVDYVEAAIAAGNKRSRDLPAELLKIQGWSSAKQKHFLNALCSHEDVVYLEIGVWYGATHIAALYGNDHVEAVAIDDFSEHLAGDGHPVKEGELKRSEKSVFLENGRRFLDRELTLHDSDYLKAREHLLENHFNVYFYDGDHSETSQCNALKEFLPFLTKRFVFVVDDYNWDHVESGTMKGIEESGVQVLDFWHLPANKVGDEDEWWNGLGVFILEKGDSE